MEPDHETVRTLLVGNAWGQSIPNYLQATEVAAFQWAVAARRSGVTSGEIRAAPHNALAFMLACQAIDGNSRVVPARRAGKD